MAADGATLSHREGRVRDFWVRHGVASRRIAEHFARDLGSPAGCNHWVPDGDKDSPADRFGPRARLVESLDRVLDDANGIDRSLCVDSVEGKLFGIGSEDYVVGSHELYLAYAVTRGVTYCMDMGHFHPTEGVHDKLSAVLQFAPRVLLHVSRPVRWDSDHVVIVNDDLRAVFQELARGEALDRASIALDYFDASMNRIAAYVTGARATRKAILMALLEPAARLRELEAGGRRGEKLALMEEAKSMPWGAAWDEMCLREGRPVGASWLDDVRRYEGEVLQVRSS
jgi:L-rhamnose isomerase